MELQKPPEMDPIVALQSKLGEMLQDPDADESVITLLKDRLRELQAERSPAIALAEKIQMQNQLLENPSGGV